MSEDNNENLYYYSNKGKQQTFNLDDLTTEELKKFEKMTERQRLKFITNFELQRDAPFQDSISLKPIMTEARNEKYGDYALLKAKLDEVESLLAKDKDYENADKISILTTSRKGISPAYLKYMNYITEDDVRNCMKAFDLDDVSLGMLKKYYNRKIESLDMPGVKISFLESLKKFYKNLIDEQNKEKYKKQVKNAQDAYDELQRTKEKDLTENKVMDTMDDLQKDLAEILKIELNQIKIPNSNQVFKMIEQRDWDNVYSFAKKYKLPQMVKFIQQFLGIEELATEVIDPSLTEPSEETKPTESKVSETVETKEEEPKEEMSVEEKKEKKEEKEEEKEEEPEPPKDTEMIIPDEKKEELPGEKIDLDSFDFPAEKPPEIDTPFRGRMKEVEQEKGLSENDLQILDWHLSMRDALRNAFKAEGDFKAPSFLTEERRKRETDKFGNVREHYSLDNSPGIELVLERNKNQKSDLVNYEVNKNGVKIFSLVYDPQKKITRMTNYFETGSKAWDIVFDPSKKKQISIDRPEKRRVYVAYTKYGKGYKVKYTSGSIIDKIRSKFLKNVEKSIDDLEKTDKNIYSKLDALESQIRELKDSLKSMETSKKEREIPIPPPPPFSKPSQPSNEKPSVFLDEIKNPAKPLKPVDKNWKIEKPQEEYSDIKKILDERRKDIEYSDDEDEDVEWGEGYSKKMKRMEILEFLKNLKD